MDERSEGKGAARWFILLLPVIMLVDHLVTWVIAARVAGVPLTAALAHYDSSWYNTIINSGYSGSNWAFFPLFPGLAKLVQSCTFGALQPQVAGAMLSTVFFAIFCVTIAFVTRDRRAVDGLLAPRTAFGWFFLVYAPASFILHSHHTEALFLLLSFAAFLFASSGKWLQAGVFAGLCCLTRIQGCFVLTAVSFAAIIAEGSAGRRLRNVAIVVATALPLAAIFPVWQYLAAGNALACMSSQAEWNHPTSTIPIYFKTFLLANPWQNHNVGSLLHHAFFFAMLFALWLMGRKSWVLSLYVLLSLVIMPAQGELVNAFRFGTVLFPVLYVLGDKIGGWSAWIKIPAAVCIVVLNHWVAVNYILNHWAY
ncbi:MAG: hypothetical protein C0404_01735 [Verrucomicrobia bacterium]|nr:hypothetical protein [Verrucomicrobiota bacterium]